MTPPPAPPYFAVIFSSQRTETDGGYGEMAELMERLAREQPGFLDVESVRDSAGKGVTISYWASRDAIVQWKAHVMHRLAQGRGRTEWYNWFSLRICLVEESRSWSSGSTSEAAAGRFPSQ